MEIISQKFFRSAPMVEQQKNIWFLGPLRHLFHHSQNTPFSKNKNKKNKKQKKKRKKN